MARLIILDNAFQVKSPCDNRLTSTSTVYALDCEIYLGNKVIQDKYFFPRGQRLIKDFNKNVYTRP